MKGSDLDYITSDLRQRGIKFTVERTRGRHQRISWTHNARRHNVIAAWSPSDWRSLINTRACIRRKLREDTGAGCAS